MAKRTPAPDEFQFPADEEYLLSFLVSGMKADKAISTHHMIAGGLGNRLYEILDPYEITHAVLSRLADKLPDEPGSVDVWLPDGKAPAQFSTPAFAVLERAKRRPTLDGKPEVRTRRDIVAAILEVPDSGAAQLFTDAGVDDLAALRQAIVDDQVPVRDDTCPPALRPTRDAFLGRRRYQATGAKGLKGFVRRMLLKLPVDYGSEPALWARLEARERALAHGGEMRSDDLLLAIVATHEVGHRFPLLIEEAKGRYEGGRRLAAAGLTSEKVLAVMAQQDLGEDAVAPGEIFPEWPTSNTAELLNGLLGVPGNRSTRLLEHAGTDPEALRPQL